MSSSDWISTSPVETSNCNASSGAPLTADRKVLVIRSIGDASTAPFDSAAGRIRLSKSLRDSRFPERTVSRSSVSASPSSVPGKCWLLTTCSGRASKVTLSPSPQAPSSCRLVVAWSESSLMTVALKKGWTSTARERYSSLVLDFDVLSHFLRILEKAVPLISTNCCSLFKSLANCWKPSWRVVNFVDRLEMPWRDCSTFFLSSRVLRRTLSCSRSTHVELSGNGTQDSPHLGFFLKVKGVDLFEFPFLGQVRRAWRAQRCDSPSLPAGRKRSPYWPAEQPASRQALMWRVGRHHFVQGVQESPRAS